jgi:NitT/TauT family transport system substrate-binding protein
MGRKGSWGWRTALLGAGVFICAGCARRPAVLDAGGRPLLRVSLQTDWFAQPEHGGFYEALVKGYYRDAGLDVEIRQASPSTIGQQVVALGQADFGIGSSNDVVVAAARGVPLVMVGALMQRDPQGLMVHRESAIRTFKDLDGHKIMALPGSPFIDVLEKIYGIRLSVTPTDFGMDRFLADKNFVQQCFVTNEPYYVSQQGSDPQVLLISDSGFSPYRVWYARRQFLTEHPDIVRAFTAASIRGWREYLNGDRAAADALIASLNPKMVPAFMNYSVEAMRKYRLVAGDPAAGEAVGRISRTRLALLIQQLGGVGLLDHPVTVDDVFDGRFQPSGEAAVAVK